MRENVAMVLNGWVYGVPVVLLAWAMLRLLQRVPARVRYVLVVGAFVAGMALQFGVRWPQPPLLYVSASNEHTKAVAAATALQNVADIIAFPLTLLWILGAATLLTREIAGHLRLRRDRRSWATAPAELRRQLEWPEHVPLAVSADASPLTIGLVTPRVVLPHDILTTFPLSVARRIALHELAHRRWRDPLVYAAMRVVLSLFWLSPLWPLLRWARREREVAADEFALRENTGDEESYVAALLRFSHLALAHRSAASAMAASDLELRAQRILGIPRRSSPVITIAVLSIAVALASIAEPVRVEPDEPTVIAPVRNAGVPPAERAASSPPSLTLPPTNRGEAETSIPQPDRRSTNDVVVQTVIEDDVIIHRHVAVHRHVVDSQEYE